MALESQISLLSWIGVFVLTVTWGFIIYLAHHMDLYRARISKTETELTELKEYVDGLEKDVDDELEDYNTFVLEETKKLSEKIDAVNWRLTGSKIVFGEGEKS